MHRSGDDRIMLLDGGLGLGGTGAAHDRSCRGTVVTDRRFGALKVIDAHVPFGPSAMTEHDVSPSLVAGAVLVSSQTTDADTDRMLRFATHEPLVRAVIGWGDLADRGAADRIADLAASAKLRGVRVMLPAIDARDWLLRDDLAAGIEAVIDHGLSLDVSAAPQHVSILAKFTAWWPDLPVVVDPMVGHAVPLDAGWRTDVARLAGQGLFCKLSGLGADASRGQPADDLARAIDHLLTAFGDRLMWGSDGPLEATNGAAYATSLEAARRLVRLSPSEERRLFGGCALAFYSLSAADPA